MVDSLKSHECIDENVSGENGGVTIPYGQIGVSDQNGHKRLPPLHGVAENNVEAQSVQASDELRNALAFLYAKREELVMFTTCYPIYHHLRNNYAHSHSTANFPRKRLPFSTSLEHSLSFLSCFSGEYWNCATGGKV